MSDFILTQVSLRVQRQHELFSASDADEGPI